LPACRGEGRPATAFSLSQRDGSIPWSLVSARIDASAADLTEMRSAFLLFVFEIAAFRVPTRERTPEPKSCSVMKASHTAEHPIPSPQAGSNRGFAGWIAIAYQFSVRFKMD